MWLPEDRDKAIAFQRAKAEVCICGTRKSEWKKDRFAYVADIDICPGCEIKEMERDNIPEDVKGAKIYLRKNVPGLEPNIVFGDREPRPDVDLTETKGLLEF
jgi:hypothetical protein